MTDILLYIMLCLIWGSTWMAIKIGLSDAPPMWSAALRFVIATIVLLIINRIQNRKYPQGLRNKWRVAWPGLFTYLGSYTMTYLGAQYISSALASILFSVFPFFVMGLMLLMFRSEKISARAVIGVVIGFIGVVLIFAEPIDYQSNTALGMILLLLSPLSAAMGTVSVKAYLKDEDVFPMVTLQIGLGAILLCVTAFLFEDITAFKVTSRSVGAMIYLSLFGSIAAFTGYYWLLKRLPLITMSMVALITPIVAALMGYVFLDEILTTPDYVGGTLVLAGVAVVNLRKK